MQLHYLSIQFFGWLANWLVGGLLTWLFNISNIVGLHPYPHSPRPVQVTSP